MPEEKDLSASITPKLKEENIVDVERISRESEYLGHNDPRDHEICQKLTEAEIETAHAWAVDASKTKEMAQLDIYHYWLKCYFDTVFEYKELSKLKADEIA